MYTKTLGIHVFQYLELDPSHRFEGNTYALLCLGFHYYETGIIPSYRIAHGLLIHVKLLNTMIKYLTNIIS